MVIAVFSSRVFGVLGLLMMLIRGPRIGCKRKIARIIVSGLL